MGLQFAVRDRKNLGQSRLNRHDHAADDDRRVHLAKPHCDQIKQTDAGIGHLALQPQARKLREDRQKDNNEQQYDHDASPAGRALSKYYRRWNDVHLVNSPSAI